MANALPRILESGRRSGTAPEDLSSPGSGRHGRYAARRRSEGDEWRLSAWQRSLQGRAGGNVKAQSQPWSLGTPDFLADVHRQRPEAAEADAAVTLRLACELDMLKAREQP